MTRDDLRHLAHNIVCRNGCGVHTAGLPRYCEEVADAIIAKCSRAAASDGGTSHVLVIEDDAPRYTASEVVRRNEQAKFRKWADRLYEIACGMRKEVGDD